jgi:hypothetical protein
MSKLSAILAALILTVVALAGQGHLDAKVIASVRADLATSARDAADAQAARVAAEGKVDDVTTAAMRLLKAYRAEKTKADYCRI